jgi:hypothetical protein
VAQRSTLGEGSNLCPTVEAIADGKDRWSGRRKGAPEAFFWLFVFIMAVLLFTH